MGEPPAASPEKGRYTQSDQRRLYPLATFNSWTARPFSYALWRLGFTPNQVSLLSLLLSLVGFLRAADGVWSHIIQGVVLVHLGLVLDHADGQVARRGGKGSTFGMFLDMLIDRVVEIGLVVVMGAIAWRGLSGHPTWLPHWDPLPSSLFLLLVPVTVGTMMLWRFLGAYTDLLYLRSFLQQAKRVPSDVVMRPKSLARRPLVPWVFNRDWVLAIWAVGLVAAQVQATLLVLLALHALSCVEKCLVFWVRHKDPEADATRIMGRDYH